MKIEVKLEILGFKPAALEPPLPSATLRMRASVDPQKLNVIVGAKTKRLDLNYYYAQLPIYWPAKGCQLLCCEKIPLIGTFGGRLKLGKWVFKPTQNNTELKMLMTNSKIKLVFDKDGNLVDKIDILIIKGR